jgi:acetylornithine deacetylase/succinyl-diaminopimelate desuccinylase-like protein
MLAAHLDVVPVANVNWKVAESFEGRIIGSKLSTEEEH